jgi:hypothetical protein
MESAIVLGDLPGARAHAPLPACSARLNQPCRADAGAVPAGSLDIPEPAESAGSKHATESAGPKQVTLLILGRPRRTRGTRYGRTLVVTVRARGGRVRNAQVVLRDRAGRRIGASKRVSIGSHPRAVLIRLTRRLRPGRYTLRATAQSIDGRAVGAIRRMTSSSDGSVG